VISKFFHEEGDTVEVGSDFLEIDTDAKAGTAAPAEAPKAAESAPAKQVRIQLLDKRI
jgi:pyruvate/2-oxoglutarate dehydrogenase complex dihydrolipoamide acyltransferase (E2) component